MAPFRWSGRPCQAALISSSGALCGAPDLLPCFFSGNIENVRLPPRPVSCLLLFLPQQLYIAIASDLRNGQRHRSRSTSFSIIDRREVVFVFCSSLGRLKSIPVACVRHTSTRREPHHDVGDSHCGPTFGSVRQGSISKNALARLWNTGHGSLAPAKV